MTLTDITGSPLLGVMRWWKRVHRLVQRKYGPVQDHVRTCDWGPRSVFTRKCLQILSIHIQRPLRSPARSCRQQAPLLLNGDQYLLAQCFKARKPEVSIAKCPLCQKMERTLRRDPCPGSCSLDLAQRISHMSGGQSRIASCRLGMHHRQLEFWYGLRFS